MTLVPAVQPAVLEDMLANQRGNHVFFELDGAPPRVVPEAAFSSLSRSILRDLAGTVVHADMPGREDPSLPLLTYGPEVRFPLWGAPGRDETNAAPNAPKLGGGSR
jgi:hypothetical protein